MSRAPAPPLPPETSLQIEERVGVDAFSSARPEWEALLARVPGALPFQTPAWSQAWIECFHIENHWRKDVALLLRIKEGERLIALVPMVRTRFRALPEWLGLIFDRPVGADPNLTELRVPLIEPGFEAAVGHALMQRARRISGLHKLALPAQAMAQALASCEAARIRRYESTPMFWLSLPETWEQLRSRLKRNIKESLRHCYNSLAREGKTPRLEVLDDADAIQKLLPSFYALHSQRAQLPGTVVHPDYFAAPKHREFLATLIGQAGLSASFQPLLFVLWVDSERVALRIGFRTHGSLYLYYSGYELSWAPYSVMTTLVAEAIQWALRERLQMVNLSIGRDTSKTRWSPEEQTFDETVLAGGLGLRGHAVRHLSRAAGLVSKNKYRRD